MPHKQAWKVDAARAEKHPFRTETIYTSREEA